MRNSSSVPQKDQDESNIPSGTAPSGKSLQNKSQFRTIAPKIVPKVLTSRVLPCPSSLSDQGSLALTSKPLGMPTQNYALMQVAGQEGTFSLFALPSVASNQPVQKPRMSLHENLKLPIPRYQPPSNKGLRKKQVLSSPKSSWNEPPGPVQTCQMSPSAQAHPELPHKTSPLKQMPTLNHSSAIKTTTLTNSIGQGDSNLLVTNSCGDLKLPAIPACATEDSSSPQSLPSIMQKADCTRKEAPTKPAVAGEELKDQVAPAHTVFSSVVQLVSLVPKGKLPIVPFSRVKATEVGKVESDADNANLSSSGCRANCDERLSVSERFDAATMMPSKITSLHGSRQNACESAFNPVTKLDLSHKIKPSSGAVKRKGRKWKVPDEILALQGKRRKYTIDVCGDGVESGRNNPQEPRDQKPKAASRKYRSIMPKPVIIMSALAPLVSSPAAALQSQAPSSLGQDVLLNNALPPKCLGSKHSDSPAPKASSVLRNRFSGIKKPWHMCPVCNHHFQFKHHLLDHMNTHTNRRPYSCGICRKAYVRPGSLNAHMKLHHGENRPKKLVCCEFCAKVFGHVRVYFGHLKEVHRVVISTEPSSSEQQPGDTSRNKDKDAYVQGPDGPLERENKSSLEEDFLLNQADEVKLQIRCARCQITAQSFAEIKFHLLHVHGEEIQGRLQEVILPDSRAGVPHQKQHPERRKQMKPWASVEDPPAFPKVKRLPPCHQNREEAQAGSEGGLWGMSSPQHPTKLLWSHSGFDCLLCAQRLGRKEDLLLHWVRQHNCEDPTRLWAILGAISNQEAPGFLNEGRQ
ncbi:zinc finger protein 438 [Phodopus roborovskii]|uniref:zinc finger protein 438 n=1 Tax=Phodopus roborovskii TaxID=109678 RepID=UPI0021E408FC|nr:zinc finger protein 438 [Phodopus roborovskii]XP_051061602.1 zinc finger protein 438 [Phodopus roborovskii]XP_051061603.1 zinc finger protein 438 [Phodopus roborovskii]XP_051061604.1 zinc finger protein 438 [Phodopus roborovskii]XP_051061605.1 zinc finger protein 438 [Phodopus roborovskii]XP_051061606.1 zinc finger protein 438 [Phodopus roborovskii]XP_051061607.1 zinc finger protein 438 [Phodopus roborovskii]